MNVGLLIIGTNKYTQFLQRLITSADKHFLVDKNVTYFIFTNKTDFPIETDRNVVMVPVEHKPWPFMTLYRYKIFTQNSEYLKDMDYLYYCDADMLFVGDFGDEILGELVATQHPGYYGRRGTPEHRPESLAYVGPNENMQYFAGGFNGGSINGYLTMVKEIDKNIDIDLSKGLIAIWHDESHMNRYFINNPPSVILSPSYCYGELMNIPFEKKLLSLDKNNFEIRQE
jgi:histo-blood group ABO system transferase